MLSLNDALPIFKSLDKTLRHQPEDRRQMEDAHGGQGPANGSEGCALDDLSIEEEVIIVRASIAIIRSGGIRGHVRSFARAAQTKRARSAASRSEEHTSELQSLMRISYAVFCLKKKTHT